MKQYEDVYFLDNAAYTNVTPLSKKQLLNELKKERITAHKKETKKKVTERGSIIYSLKIDKYNIRIHFSSKYLEINKKYIEELDKWEKADRKGKLKELRKTLIIIAATAGATTIVNQNLDKIIVEVEDLLTDEVSDLEREIKIHSGHETTPDGKEVSPYLGHGCVLGSDKSISVQDRIVNYCEKYDLEYMKEAAIEKYELYYRDNIEEAEKIDLKEIEKEHKENQKSKKN